MTAQTYLGLMQVIYFGYTHCPGICPIDAANIAQAVDLLGPAAREVQPLFITIDPARDTALRLSQWLGAIHPRFVGLTGTERAVAAAAKAFKVVYERVETEKGYDYAVVYPGLIYIIDRDGHFLFLLPPGTSPEVIADELRAALNPGDDGKMLLPRPFNPPILPIAHGIISIVFLVALLLGVQSTGTTSAADANVEDGTLEIFCLADRTNLKRLDNGDFMFRLARDLRTGIVYWAYMGSTRHVFAVAPERRAFADDAVARAALLRIADLPRRVGCGVGLIHRSWVYVVPEGVRFGASGAAPDIGSILVKGEVRNDGSGPDSGHSPVVS